MKRKDNNKKIEELKDDFLYQTLTTISNFMDRKFIDPLLGFLFPAFGDTLTIGITLPYLYVSIFKIKSLPLTLAILLNSLIDVLVGLIPYGIGDILDIFYCSYAKNLRLIEGFLCKDEKIVREVKTKAWITGLLVILLCFIIYFVISLFYSLIMGGYHLISDIIGQII